MKKTFKLISFTLLFSLFSQILPANLVTEKTQKPTKQEPKIEHPEQATQANPAQIKQAQAKHNQKEILEKKETKKEKRARLRKEKKAAKQEKKLKLKQEKEAAKKNKPEISPGKKIVIGVGITTLVFFGVELLLGIIMGSLMYLSAPKRAK